MYGIPPKQRILFLFLLSSLSVPARPPLSRGGGGIFISAGHVLSWKAVSWSRFLFRMGTELIYLGIGCFGQCLFGNVAFAFASGAVSRAMRFIDTDSADVSAASKNMLKALLPVMSYSSYRDISGHPTMVF